MTEGRNQEWGFGVGWASELDASFETSKKVMARWHRLYKVNAVVGPGAKLFNLDGSDMPTVVSLHCFKRYHRGSENDQGISQNLVGGG